MSERKKFCWTNSQALLPPASLERKFIWKAVESKFVNSNYACFLNSENVKKLLVFVNAKLWHGQAGLPFSEPCLKIR
jgi:hypothetical protein